MQLISKFSKEIRFLLCIIDIVNKHNEAYQSTIKMKTVDVKSNTYIKSSNEINDEDPKFKIGDIVRISKYFCKRLCSKLVWRSFCDSKI